MSYGSTLNVADLFGIPSSQTPSPPTDRVSGPGRGSETSVPAADQDANAGIGAAASWLGFVALLVIWRIAMEAGGKVE